MAKVAYGPDQYGPPEELQELICNKIAAGFSVAAAAGAADMPPTTVHGWLHKGRKAREKMNEGLDLKPQEIALAVFLERYERACGKRAMTLEELLTRRGDASNGAGVNEARFKLERLHHEDWADKSRERDSGGGGVQIVIAGALEARPQVLVRGLPGADDADYEGLPAPSSAGELSP